MTMARHLDRRKLLERLERVPAEPKLEDGDPFQQLSLAAALLGAADLGHDREYETCKDVAEHLLGHVPEPDVEDEDI